MKKILILANNDIGLYNFRKELLYGLIKKGYYVYIALPYGDRIEELKDLGCTFIETKVDRRGLNPIEDFLLFLTYLKLFAIIKPDILISYTIKPNMYGGIASRLFQLDFFPYVAGLGTPFQKNTIIRKILILGHRIAFKKARAVFFENSMSLQFYRKQQIVNSNVIKIPGAGVNLEEYSYYNYPEDEKEIHFLFIGRIMKEKGIVELLQAAERIKNEFSNAQFDIIGSYEEAYKNTMTKMEEKGVINYWGFQKNVKPFLEKTHCLILPSWHEGMANVLLEAAATGRPLITTDIPGCREAVITNITGYLVRKDDAGDLYLAIKKFLNLDNNERRLMGIKSRQHMESVFDRTMVVHSMLAEIEKCEGKLF